MKVMVNGLQKELVAIGQNGIEWTKDLLGNYDALHYDEDKDEYTMTSDEFDYWEPIIDTYNKIIDMEQELDEETADKYNNQNFDYCDLEDELTVRLDWLNNYVK